RRLFGPAESLAFLAIGTGICAGVVLDGVLHRGAHGLAGEIGHVTIEPDGIRCACGNRGCFETVAAGPALVSRTLAAWASSRNGHDDAAARAGDAADAGDGPGAGGAADPGGAPDARASADRDAD